MDGISRDTFERMDTDSKLNVLFDMAIDAHGSLKKLGEKLDRKRKVDTAIAGAMGFVGGFVASMGRKFL